MKVRLFLLSFVFALFLGCSSDDNGSSELHLAVNEHNLLGKWYPKATSVNGGEFQNYEHNCSSQKDVKEFFSNGELSFSKYWTNCESLGTTPALWSLEGDILTIENSEFDPVMYYHPYKVISLTTEELTLRLVYDSPDGSVIEISKYTRN